MERNEVVILPSYQELIEVKEFELKQTTEE